jgi:uncharacterized protein (TIGR04255 family)
MRWLGNNLETIRTDLPSFKNPPLVETVIGLQFSPIPGLTQAHLGLLWQALRHKLPKVSEAEWLPGRVEVFGEPPGLPLALRVGPGRGKRLLMASDDDREMLQIQNGLIAFNWRRGGAGQYPRWRALLGTFNELVDKFKQLLSTEGLRDATVHQWEVVYVNHLLKGRDWASPADWQVLVPGIVAPATKLSLGKLESLDGSVHFVIPDKSARVHVDFAHGFRAAKAAREELVSLQITARGEVRQPGDRACYLEGLELGHVAVVKTFCELTSPVAQKKWEREE